MIKNILIIDDDTYICNLLVDFLTKNGYQAEGVFSGLNGMKKIEKEKYDLILCDYRLPDSDGLKILQTVQKKKKIPVIIMTAYAEVKMAVKLIKSGAFDYVTKPIQPEEILRLINKALQKEKDDDQSFEVQSDFITGSSKQIKKVMEHISVVAPTDLTVLIEGETGSGKEYIARALHESSKRAGKPFVALDCGAIPKELASSELFGHVKGAFTGAINDKKGCFEQAKGGTLFLDEVGNLHYENQVKLLRAIQEKKITRVGANRSISVDVRIVTATNEDLLKQVGKNEFREDLYHRLNGFKVQIPSLRERGDDIFEFAENFIQKASASFQKDIKGLSDEVRNLFIRYNWYGNIRELQNVLNRAVLLSSGPLIETDVLPEEIKYLETGNARLSEQSSSNGGNITELKEATLETEKEMISNALARANYNKSKAAVLLKIDRKTLYNKIKQYNIDALKI